MGTISAIVKWILNAGFFIYPVLILLVLGAVIIIERIYMILFVYRADGGELMKRVQRLILDNNIDEAVKLCNSKKNAAIYQVFKAALVSADRPIDEIQEQVEVANLLVIPKLQERMPYLFTIANTATLFGLLGTIMGLIDTFRSIGEADAAQKQALLSLGISTAMNTTAVGLIVAIPCSLAYGFLLNQINTIVDSIEHYSARLLVLLRTGNQYFDRNGEEEAAAQASLSDKLAEKSSDKLSKN